MSYLERHLGLLLANGFHMPKSEIHTIDQHSFLLDLSIWSNPVVMLGHSEGVLPKSDKVGMRTRKTHSSDCSGRSAGLPVSVDIKARAPASTVGRRIASWSCDGKSREEQTRDNGSEGGKRPH